MSLKDLGTAFFAVALAAAPGAATWEVTAAAAYGQCFLQGAPYGYYDEVAEPRTNEPLAARLDVAAGRWGGEFLYAQRYEAYPEVGKTEDLTLTFRGAPVAGAAWALYGVAGLGIAKAPAGLAFFHFGPGPYYYWTPVAGGAFRWRAARWLDVNVAADFRYRPQTVDYFKYYHSYGTVKSPAATATFNAAFHPGLGLTLGPRLEYITYGPYDYYLYGKTDHSAGGWQSGREWYVMAEVGWRFSFD